MGADFAYMGTRFITTKESRADQAYQDMIITSGTKDIIYTAAVSGVNANFMRQSLEDNGITEELWAKKGKLDFGKDKTAAEAEAKAWKTIWSAGQGVATINEIISVQELTNQLAQGFQKCDSASESIS